MATGLENIFRLFRPQAGAALLISPDAIPLGRMPSLHPAMSAATLTAPGIPDSSVKWMDIVKFKRTNSRSATVIAEYKPAEESSEWRPAA